MIQFDYFSNGLKPPTSQYVCFRFFFGDSAVPRMENQPVPLARLQVSPPKASPGVSGFGWVAKDPKISEKTTQAQVMTFFLRKRKKFEEFLCGFLVEADFSYINKCWSFRYAFDFFCSVAVYANMGQGRNNSEWISSGGCTKREDNKGGFG